MLEETKNRRFIHSISEEANEVPIKKIALLFCLTAIFGIFSGFIVYKTKTLWHKRQENVSQKPKKIVGIQDKKTFKDHAEGILKEGGIDGEGQFHLERPGGESQNVYLTSTTVDLSQYVGKRVRVWGETFAAQKAGWLMNVGLVEIL